MFWYLRNKLHGNTIDNEVTKTYEHFNHPDTKYVGTGILSWQHLFQRGNWVLHCHFGDGGLLGFGYVSCDGEEFEWRKKVPSYEALQGVLNKMVKDEFKCPISH